MRARFLEISQMEEFDISLQEDNVFRRCRRPDLLRTWTPPLSKPR